MTTTLTGKNQVTVLAEITQKLGLVVGTQFQWSIGEGSKQLIIQIKPPRKELLKRVQVIGRTANFRKRSPVKYLVRDRIEDDQNEGMGR